MIAIIGACLLLYGILGCKEWIAGIGGLVLIIGLFL